MYMDMYMYMHMHVYVYIYIYRLLDAQVGPSFQRLGIP